MSKYVYIVLCDYDNGYGYQYQRRFVYVCTKSSDAESVVKFNCVSCHGDGHRYYYEKVWL